MANYIITTKIIRGTPSAAAAEAETYLETIDSTTQPIVDISVVGDSNSVTIIIIHQDTA